MDNDLLAALAVVGSIALACGVVVWWVYAEFPSRDEHLHASRASDRQAAEAGRVRAPAPLWLRLFVTAASVACVTAGFAIGEAALPLGVGGAATLVVWLARPRTSYGRRLAAAAERRPGVGR